MKKRDVISLGILFLCGAVFVLLSLFNKELVHGSTIFATGISFMAGAVIAVAKRFYWQRPKNKPTYDKCLHDEKINLNDERKVMLRQKSGQISYIIMFYVLTIVNLIFTFAGVEKWIILTLWGVILFQYVCGLLVYKNLSAKM